jgi:hypothetical protein
VEHQWHITRSELNFILTGTTLNLLKFPIVDPTQWRLAIRAKRLLKARSEEQEENKLRKSLLQSTKKSQYASLIGQYAETLTINMINMDWQNASV